MLGHILSLLVSAAPALASASVTCPDGPASCDGAALALALVQERDPEPVRGYATPAVIDCRSEVVPAVLLTLVGECDGTPRDASYRASRYPESELDRGALTPAVPAADRRSGPVVNELPPAGGDLIVSAPQPVAVFALPTLVLAARDAPLPASALELPFRNIEPPERPPRA